MRSHYARLLGDPTSPWPPPDGRNRGLYQSGKSRLRKSRRRSRLGVTLSSLRGAGGTDVADAAASTASSTDLRPAWLASVSRLLSAANRRSGTVTRCGRCSGAPKARQLGIYPWLPRGVPAPRWMARKTLLKNLKFILRRQGKKSGTLLRSPSTIFSRCSINILQLQLQGARGGCAPSPAAAPAAARAHKP